MRQTRTISEEQNFTGNSQNRQSVTITITLETDAGKPEIHILPHENKEECVTNWFDSIETVASDAPMEYSEKHYSVCDTLDTIVTNDRAFRILTNAIYSMSGMKMTKSLAAMMGGRTLQELASTLESADVPGTGKKVPENAMQIINAELNKVLKK